jgi:acetoin utilization protein AcuB
MKVGDIMSTNVVTVTEDTLVNDAKKIMVKNPFTISPGMPVEEALQLGQEKGYGAFPVVDDGRLVGVVTESDIVRMMTRVLGVKEQQGVRIDIRNSSKEFGFFRGILDILDKKRTLLLSMMTLPPPEDEPDWLIALRVQGDDIESVANELKAGGYNVSYVG